MPTQSARSEAQIMLTGLAMGESPRWHEGRLWFADWGAQQIIAVDAEGKSEVMLSVQFGLPFCIDWLPDGRLLIVSGREGRLLRREPDILSHRNRMARDGQGFRSGESWHRSGVDRRIPGACSRAIIDNLSDHNV